MCLEAHPYIVVVARPYCAKLVDGFFFTKQNLETSFVEEKYG